MPERDTYQPEPVVNEGLARDYLLRPIGTAVVGGAVVGGVAVLLELASDQVGFSLFHTNTAYAWECPPGVPDTPENEASGLCVLPGTPTVTPTAVKTSSPTPPAASSPVSGGGQSKPPSVQAPPPENKIAVPPTTPTPETIIHELCVGSDSAHGHVIVTTNNEFVQLFPPGRFGFDQWTPESVQVATTMLTPTVVTELTQEYEARCQTQQIASPPAQAAPPATATLVAPPTEIPAPSETPTPTNTLVPTPSETPFAPPTAIPTPTSCGQQPCPEIPIMPQPGGENLNYVQSPEYVVGMVSLPGGIETVPLILSTLYAGGKIAAAKFWKRN